VKPLLALAAFFVASLAYAQNQDCDTLQKCQEALKANTKSSLAHFRIAEIFFKEEDYQSAANEFRLSLGGDAEPKWTEVWAHINLGKIFDTTHQRNRAIKEYKAAQRTGDDTRGAQEEATKYIETPFTRDQE
jgi:predicted negative regulator of RcsB-dependent stress response